VTAANNDGIWSSAPSTLRFLVEPFFWQTIWFRIVALGSVLGGACVAVWQLGQSKIHQHIGRLQQQRAIEQERARLGSVLEATSDFVAFSNPYGEVLFINAAGRRMIGLAGEKTIQGMHLPDFHPDWVAHRVLDTGLTIAKRDGIWSGETALQHRDGREIPVSQVIVAHKNPDGTLNFLSTIVRDITERQQAEDKLRKANARLHKLSAHLIDIQESERRFIAKELHDEIGQSLTAATLSFQNVQATSESAVGRGTLKEGISILNEVLSQVRDLSLDLRPAMLDHVGLAAAIRWQVDRIAQRVALRQRRHD
jgi:PAS domain S-box-containing protein